MWDIFIHIFYKKEKLFISQIISVKEKYENLYFPNLPVLSSFQKDRA